MNLFYTPDIENTNILPEDEASHIVRVLRLREGDEIYSTDGKGALYELKIMSATNKRCVVEIISKTLPSDNCCTYSDIHIAVAPTKNMDRNEWFAEKATEIGIGKISYVSCKFSERKVIKTDRIEKIVVSAMKQSLKYIKPSVSEMTDFRDFVNSDFGDAKKFIAHCYDMPKQELKKCVKKGDKAVVLIGPEGDFSKEEVEEAMSKGFIPVSLSSSRLRTETAALVACHTISMMIE